MAADNNDSPQAAGRPAKRRPTKAERIDRDRAAITAAFSTGSFSTLLTRVASILNQYPDARNSDEVLAHRYWREFYPNEWDGELLSLSSMLRMEKFGSIKRCRARIQNDIGLLKADEGIIRKRAALEAEWRDALRQARQPSERTLSVYADESGKTGQFLIVGSVWTPLSRDGWELQLAIETWKQENNFTGELHFKKIKAGNLRFYLDFVTWLREQQHVIAYKSIMVPNRGFTGGEGLMSLFRALLIRGVEHEHETGRAPLPRTLMLLIDEGSDAEKHSAEGSNRSFFTDLTADLKADAQASEVIRGQLVLGWMNEGESAGNTLLQLADLYAGSINRILNEPAEAGNAKYDFAVAFLEMVGLQLEPGRDTPGEMRTDTVLHMRHAPPQAHEALARAALHPD